MFAAMAGVRGDDIPHLKPRGRLRDMAYSARNDDSHYVCDSQVEPTSGSGDEYYYSRAHAEEYVAKGYCEWTDESKSFVTNSDHHTHSWMTADEFELSIACYLKKSGFMIGVKRLEMVAPETLIATDEAQVSALSYITEYWAILASMRCFEAQGHEARLIFWFDN